MREAMIGLIIVVIGSACVVTIALLGRRSDPERRKRNIEPSRNGYSERNRHVTHDSD